MFYSPHYHHFAEKNSFFFRSRVCFASSAVYKLLFLGITCDTVSMDRHEKEHRWFCAGLSHVGRVSQTTIK